MKYQNTVLEIKASLFDFHDLFSNDNNSESRVIIEHFNYRIKSILKAEHSIIILDKNQLSRIMSRRNIASLRSVINSNDNLYDKLEQLFQSVDDVVIKTEEKFIENNQHPYHIIMRLSPTTNFQGFYLFSFPFEPDCSVETLDEIQHIIDKHFEFMLNHIQEKFIQERNQLLFQLSANLHSVHSTTDVLKRVYRSVKLLYPKFEYRFLMSHELDDSSVPIYTIEYFDNSDFLGTTAFINNELQIEYDADKNQTIIYSPLTGRQGVYGVLEVTIPTQVHLIQQDYEFIKQSSKMIGRAVERTTLYQTSTQLVTDLQFINIASRDLNRNLEEGEISENVKKHITASCRAEEIGIVLFPNGDDELNHKFIIADESTQYFKANSSTFFIEYLYERLHERPEPILSGNFKVEGIAVPYNSIMVIPMWDSEKMFGMIVIVHESPYYFSFDKYKFVQSFVQHAALAYTNSMLKERLRKTAITDYLTKLYLRNHLDKKIDEHMKKDQGGSFMLLDVDDFKMVNDTYGHYVGDKVLIQVAEVIKGSISDQAIAARWGGEEFAVYLPSCNEDYAMGIANGIREKVITNTNPQVTLSIGISSWCQDKHTIEKLFIRADEALYEAKTTGKNRVVIK